MERPADIELMLPALERNVTVARQALSGLADVDGWQDEFLNDVKIALSEACSNVVVHAYRNGDVGTMTVRIWQDDDQLQIRVSDHGAGITPNLGGKAGLGLGLPLMAAISDELKMQTNEGGGTEVRMRFTVPVPQRDGR